MKEVVRNIKNEGLMKKSQRSILIILAPEKQKRNKNTLKRSIRKSQKSIQNFTDLIPSNKADNKT